MLLSILLAPFTGYAFEGDIEEDLQTSLERSRSIIISIQKKILLGASLSSEIINLRSAAENIRTTDLLLGERFKLREEKVKALGTKALDRHQVMVGGYRKALNEYLSLIESLTASDDSQPAIRNPLFAAGSSQVVPLKTQQLLDLLNKLLPKKKRPIIGSLPYKYLNYPSRQLTTAASITPAYLGGNKTLSPDDTATAPEAPISTEIAALAQSLNWNPVSIYEYVKNNIDTEWYWGCMKGPEDTLHQKSGNDCDQAALLAALLRVSGFPTRYVRGVIQFFPDIEKAKNLTGIDNPAKIAESFQKAGVPFNPVIAGGKIANIQIEHVWVESQIPYSNYRGAIIDTMGKTWLGLDTSIKVKGYTYNNARDILSVMSLSTVRDEYLGLVTVATPSMPFELNQTPLEYLKSSVNAALFVSQPTTTYSDYLRSKTIVPEVLNILPGSLQFKLIKATNEYTTLPDDLIHKVKFTATDLNKNELLTITLPSYKLSNQQIAISYEPETVQDQEIIDSYGGLDNTPAYLVHLRPVLKVNGKRIVVAQGGVPMGGDFNLAIDLISPNGTESISNTHIVGNLSVIGISAQKAVVTPSPLAGEGGGEGGKDAERLLYEDAMNYNDRWNKAEDELASLFHLAIIRPLPTVVTLGGVIDVTYLLDTPHGFTWKGVFIDAGLRSIEIVSSSIFGVQNDRQKLFMQLSSLQGSILENRIFEDDFQVQSVSTAKLMTLANGGQVPIITIHGTNIDSVLPALPFDHNIKEDITNAVNQYLTVSIPQSEIAYQDWTGIGYVKENLATGESGWMLSGMIAGGMTVWSNDRWPAYYHAILSDPYSEPSIFDPASAKFIAKISATDLQRAPVGTRLGSPFQVIVHTDQMRPVAGASVTFTIKAGKGSLTGIDAQGNQVAGATVTVPTNGSGIASALLITGQSTTVNSTYWYYPSTDATRPNPEQVGENLVDAQLPSGTGIATPFAAYGFPKAARMMKLLHGDGLASSMLFLSGFASVIIQDEHGNPISNLPVTFEALAPDYDAASMRCNPQPDLTKLAYFIPTSEPCLRTAPVWGTCGNTNQQSLQRITTSQGALAEIMMGGIPYAIYPFKATCIDAQKCQDPATNQLLSIDFQQYTTDYSCGTELHMQTLYPTDIYGNNINAGKTDTQIPVMAKMYYLRNSGVSTSFDTASVTFGGQQGTAQPNGVFTGSHTLTAGPNWVNAQGSATINGTHYTESITFQVYGVNITLAPPLILLDSFGYSKSDTVIPFTIAPAEYTAMTAYMVILKNGGAIEYIPVEKHGRGYATIGRGFWFDVNSTYSVYLTLNNGTGVEIKSDPVTLPVAQMRVMTDESSPKEADEIKFSDGSDHSNGTKKYHIEIKSQSWLSSCETLTGRIVTLSTATATMGQPVNTPQNTGDAYAAGYTLAFKHPLLPLGNNLCNVQIVDALDNGSRKDKFILSNRSRTTLDVRLPYSNIYNTAVLYGGLGNKFWLEVGGVVIAVPIEPVGVVILGIDGMRQDVLYKPDEQQVNQAGQTSPYYVDPAQLNGLCEVLGGKKDLLLPCNLTGWDNRHFKFQNVTAIFPSITFASWASIFTGKLPNETGITGNEFFARDIFADATDTTPGLYMLPKGMVTLDADGGAFRPLVQIGVWSSKEATKSLPFVLNHIMPAEFSGFGYQTPTSKKAVSTPNSVLQTETLWSEINNLMSKRFHVSTTGNDKCGSSQYECRTVSMFNQYSRGASRHIYSDGVDWWGTPASYSTELKAIFTSLSVPDILDTAAVMDKSAAAESIGFINGYFTQNNQDGKRKRFPGVFSVYLSGLDHEAHVHGLGDYKNYFIETVDSQIKDIVEALKDKDEFDNKIFIIVSDHGHTAMPTDLTYIQEVPMQDIETQEPYVAQFVRQAEMSCTLKTNFAVNSSNDFEGKNAQNAELNNNNLHIWEMGEIFKAIGDSGGTQYKMLAPQPIANLYTGETSTGLQFELPYGATANINNSNVIAALNGPMAHIYLKSANGWSDENPDIVQLSILAKFIKRYVQEGGVNIDDNETKEFFNKLLFSVDRILIRVDGVYKDFKGVDTDISGNVIGPNAATINGIYFDENVYVSAFNRIANMNHAKRSGDIVLIMKDSTTGADSDRYTTAYACKSWHGGLNRSDSYVPFIVSYPGGNKSEIQSFIDTTPGCNSTTGCDGNWRVTDLIKTMVQRQCGAQ